MKAIATGSIDAWLSLLSRDAEVFVPRRNPGGDVVLVPAKDGPRETRYRRLSESPKRILLPQVEHLVWFEGGRGRAQLDETHRVLFGLRPCDAAAIAILDAFFARDYPDPHYLARRKRMHLIVVACIESEDTCFCASTDTGPVGADGFDVQLFDLGDLHLAVAGTGAGEKMVAAGGELFRQAPPDAQGRLEEFRRRARENQKVHLDLFRAQEIIRNRAEGSDFWQKVADRCLMCAGCAYLCPTCTCYDLADRQTGAGTGVRQRLWDSCVLEGFTREASGFNPRGEQPSRCAHRYLHKLGGSDVPNRSFRCVGCGRCADACISAVGIIRVIQELLDSPTQKRLAGAKAT